MIWTDLASAVVAGAMALSIDSEAPPELQAQFRGEGFDDVRFVTLRT